QLAQPLLFIGIVSFLMSTLGFYLGRRFGQVVTRRFRPELLGGLILIAIGIKILLEHLLG
ncbi:MAG: manganese efflux pump, partial [Bacteroidales bacterium]|nr:manganese efflux pump [Bacteroidales bacterium]